MNHVMQAVDEQIALNALYHATYGNLPVGGVVEHWGVGDGYSAGFVDSLRPEGMGFRRGHFFMTEDPECLPRLGRSDSDLKLYEVSPVDAAGPFNYAWLDQLSWMNPARREDIDSVRSYWSKKKHPDVCGEEYLAKSMRVDRYLGSLGDTLGL